MLAVQSICPGPGFGTAEQKAAAFDLERVWIDKGQCRIAGFVAGLRIVNGAALPLRGPAAVALQDVKPFYPARALGRIRIVYVGLIWIGAQLIAVDHASADGLATRLDQHAAVVFLGRPDAENPRTRRGGGNQKKERCAERQSAQT